MTLTEYKTYIDALVKAGHGKKIVITSCDDEGNSYDDVKFAPSVIDVRKIEYSGLAKDKAVCLN